MKMAENALKSATAINNKIIFSDENRMEKREVEDYVLTMGILS